MGFAAQRGATGGEADLGSGQRDSGHGDQSDQIKDIDLAVPGHGCAGHRHQRINGHAFRGRIKPGEHFEHFETIFDGFAQAEDTPAANGHSGVLHIFDGAEPIVIGVTGHDIRIMFAGSIDVVVVSGHPGSLELAGFFRSEFT